MRHFYRAPVHERRNPWTHSVTGSGEERGEKRGEQRGEQRGEERGEQFEFFWVNLPPTEGSALNLDDYLHALTSSAEGPGTRTGRGLMPTPSGAVVALR